MLIEPAHMELSVAKQCALLNVGRSGLYYSPVKESEENLAIMRLLDEQYLKTPFLWGGKIIGFIGGDGLCRKPQTGKAVDETDGLANPLLHTPDHPHRPCRI
jgi:hypothetical protein